MPWWLPPLRWLRKARSPRRPHTLLYTRQHCPLCDQALELLRRHGLQPQLIDIDLDPQLRDRYTHCVPVVLIAGKERFRGRVNPVLLRRLLKHEAS